MSWPRQMRSMVPLSEKSKKCMGQLVVARQQDGGLVGDGEVFLDDRVVVHSPVQSRVGIGVGVGGKDATDLILGEKQGVGPRLNGALGCGVVRSDVRIADASGKDDDVVLL